MLERVRDSALAAAGALEASAFPALYGKWIRVAEKAADRLDDTISVSLDEVVAKR